MGTRNGTDVDAAIAMKTFTQLGYKVKVANDQTVDKMHALIDSGNKKKKKKKTQLFVSPIKDFDFFGRKTKVATHSVIGVF